MFKNQKHTRHLPRSNAAELFGWLGSILILSAYALLSFGLLNADDTIYHALFLVGSSALAVVTYRHKAFQSFTVNTFFSLIALFAIIRTLYFS